MNMQKIVIITFVIALFSFSAMAQDDRKVAVFDPAGNVESHFKEIVREEISSIIVNTKGYTVLERQLIDRVLEENRFQMGGLVDDAQISEIGKRMGANFVFVTNITPMGNNLYISCKMVDVLTARIEKQKTAQTQRGTTDLLSVVQSMAKEMFSDAPQPPQTPRQTVVDAPAFAGTLTADGRKVWQGSKQLSKNEVRNIMANTDALRLYNKGISRNRNGNIYLWSGIGLCLIGTMMIGAAEYEELDTYGNYQTTYDSGLLGLGVSSMFLGSAGIVAGATMKLTSKKPVRQSVDMYNRGGGGRAGMELDFGFTGNGVGVALRF